MEISTDPYEQKLYHMFTSHDTESKGSLDKIALSKLCKTLELKDKREELLVACLMKGSSGANNRVTFKQFKEGLLRLLGTEDGSNADEFSTKLTNEPNSNLPDEEDDKDPQSPSREVSPKFVVGSKKYGRRSRPQSASFDSTQSSDSENENNSVVPQQTQQHSSSLNQHKNTSHYHSQQDKKSQKVQRSSSHSEIHGTKRRRPLTNSKLKRCASLPAQKQKIEEKTMLATQLESSVESLGNLDVEHLPQQLYNVWMDYGHDTNHRLNRIQLEVVCERVGFNKIANKVADEVFEKLGLNPKNMQNRICFNEFIALIQSDHDPTTATEDDSCSAVGDDDDNNDNNGQICDDDDNNSATTEQNSSCTIQENITSPNSHDLLLLHASHTDEWPVVESTAVPIDYIIDLWDMAGITNSKKLLHNLGFTTKDIHISQLSLAIDEDLQQHQEPVVDGSGEENHQSANLLKASLALHKAEVNGLQQAFKQLHAENRKLHANNREANRRATLLAQEVDERHAHLETSAQSEIRQLEQRHADIVRDLSTQLTNDRENWTSLTQKLEKRIKLIESEDAKHRQDVISQKEENSALEVELIKLQKQIAEILEANIKLTNELCELEDRQRTDDSTHEEKQSHEMMELMDKIQMLQLENSNLRDKNDELLQEIDDKSLEVLRLKGKTSKLPSDGDDFVESSVSSFVLAATKRRGDSPSKAKISEESPRLGKQRKCNNDGAEIDSEGSGDWLALNSELNQSAGQTTTTSGFSQEFSSLNDSKDEELKQLKQKLAELELRIKSSDGSEEDSVDQLKQRNQDLEASLEQMHKAYEECEDYWKGKLDDERKLYEDEQRNSDDKFTELLKKMSEYEEQFSATLAMEDEKDGRLSPIEEKCQLEQQYSDLEVELEDIKDQARQMLDEKAQEINKLKQKVEDLQKRTVDSTDRLTVPSPAALEGNESPASSPINYLWHQSTIQAPARDYQNPNWRNEKQTSTPQNVYLNTDETANKTIAPIQRPISPPQQQQPPPPKVSDSSDTSSVKSFGTHSIASTHSIHRPFPDAINNNNNICSSPTAQNGLLREELKRLKIMELQLREAIQELQQQKDSLVMELQQLQEAKPVLEKAYARTSHPSLMQRIQHLEQKNRNLQMNIKQQQHYTETIVHQTWQQQRTEITDLCQRLENQGLLIQEQTHRLANADILVKDLYVENAQLSAAVQRLEQQRTRNSLILQHQGLTGVSTGMPTI